MPYWKNLSGTGFQLEDFIFLDSLGYWISASWKSLEYWISASRFFGILDFILWDIG
ncbi:hypothetical protein C1646_777601 [Rhizophagus diaphanus]|nr:hypothetical protein C1646_777601 [Rhizophagus diaphanus] [Rhizophagus sp. MUCL 43196]